MKFNEDFLIKDIDYSINKRRQQEALEKKNTNFENAYTKALKILAIDRIDEREFVDLYSEENVKSDLTYVAEKEEKFKRQDTVEEEEAKKWAKILEAIIHHQVEINDWLGENAITKKSSNYDDIKNGVDCIVELQQPDKSMTSHLALAIDVTFSSNLVDKMDRIKEEIDSGQLATIKYFKSDFLHIRGEKKNIPRVVVGVDKKNLNRITGPWLNNKNRIMADHPIKFLMIEEILLQLKSYKNYAEKIKQTEAADNINKVLKIIEDVFKNEDRDLSERRLKEIETDKVYDAIKIYHKNLSANKN